MPTLPRTAKPAVSLRLLPVAVVTVFVGVLAYLVVLPLVRLQTTAFENGAHGYRTAFGSPGIGEVIWTTVALAVGSLVIAMVLGTALAWAATQLPPRYRLLRSLPVLPIVIPAVANVI